MSRIAKNDIYFGQDIEPKEVAARSDATTNDAIVALAQQLLRPDTTALTLLGDSKARPSATNC